MDPQHHAALATACGDAHSQGGKGRTGRSLLHWSLLRPKPRGHPPHPRASRVLHPQPCHCTHVSPELREAEMLHSAHKPPVFSTRFVCNPADSPGPAHRAAHTSLLHGQSDLWDVATFRGSGGAEPRGWVGATKAGTHLPGGLHAAISSVPRCLEGFLQVGSGLEATETHINLQPEGRTLLCFITPHAMGGCGNFLAI